MDTEGLIDQHCHGVRRDDLDRSAFEELMSEGGPPAPGTTHFDSPLGLGIRHWCAPLLDLEPYAPAGAYLERRAELGAREVNRRLLRAAGVTDFCVDTGLPGPLLSPAEMGECGAGRGHEVVRIERVAEDVAARRPTAAGYAMEFADELARRASTAVAVKTIIAYRCGLDFDPTPPATAEVTAAAARWLAAPGRLTDPVLLRHALWTGVELAHDYGLPIQVHTGFGGADLTLRRANPVLLTEFVRAAPVPLVLLHCYPYLREAACLAAVYPTVSIDIGLAVTHTAASSGTVIGEVLELAPFHKVLFSTDCHGLAELCFLGAHYFRRGLAAVLAAREWPPAETARIAHLVGAGNARRLYSLQAA